jgi:hypothetical protein
MVQIPKLESENDTRTRSAQLGYILYLANIQEIQVNYLSYYPATLTFYFSKRPGESFGLDAGRPGCKNKRSPGSNTSYASIPLRLYSTAFS